MKEDEEIRKQAEEKVEKQLKDGNVGLFSFLREPTVTIEEIQDLKPMLALENSAPALALTMEAETDTETDVDEPPPCPVHMM